MRFSITSCWILAVTAAVLTTGAVGEAQAQSYTRKPLTTAPLKQMVHFQHNVSESGSQAFSTSIGPLAVSSEGYGVSKATAKLPHFPVSAPFSVSVSNPVSKSDALAASKTWVGAQVIPFTKRAADWLKAEGLSTAIYTYSHDIMVSAPDGVPRRQAISFNVTIDNKGRTIYGNPKITDPDPVVVEIIYTPLRPAEGLPSGWKYPDAGKIKYRLIDMQNVPKSDWMYVDTGGAFDEDLSDTGSRDEDARDTDSKLKCFVDLRYPGCSGPVDVRGLIDRTGATFAMVDYVRRLEPDYEEVPGTADEYGDAELRAKGALSVDARIYDCVNYINRGHFGFVLTMRAEKYIVHPSEELLTYQLIEQFGGKTLSPTEPYEKTMPVSGLAGRHPSDIVLSPYEGDDPYWTVADTARMRDVLYLAPVTAEGSDGVLSDTVFSGDMAVTLLSSSGNTREYYIGTVGDNYWHSGAYDRTIYFNLDNPGTLEELAIIQEGFDDHLLVAVNGYAVFIGPYGGDMLQVETQAGQQCPQYSVQYRSNATGMGNGCAAQELATSWVKNEYINLNGYLQSGANSIFMRTIVAGRGEGWLKLRTRTCGASLGLQVQPPPPPPASGGSAGVRNYLDGILGSTLREPEPPPAYTGP